MSRNPKLPPIQDGKADVREVLAAALKVPPEDKDGEKGKAEKNKDGN